MLLSREVLLKGRTGPIMVLEKYELDSSILNLDSVRAELNSFISLESGESFSWGFFPGMEDEEKEKYSESINLGNKLKNALFDDREWEFAFVKSALKKPVSPFGGFHLDVDVGAGIRRTDDREIVRAIVNLHNSPRIFLYSFADREQLRNIGLKIPLKKYKRIYLPEKFVRKIEIPPAGRGEVYILKFISSLIPHFGYTDEKGEFVAGFGMYSDEASI